MEDNQSNYNQLLRDGDMTVSQLRFLLEMFPDNTKCKINRNMLSFEVLERPGIYFLGDNWREF